MNQILNFRDNPDNVSKKEDAVYTSYNSQKQKKIYFFQFMLSLILALCFFIIIFIRVLKNKNEEYLSMQLLSSYKISTLYSKNKNYTINKLSVADELEPFVIGMIKIDKINLSYPILSKSNKNLLNISVCRFAGPMPNEPGNLCIAGHNYVDYKLFSNLHKLNQNDKVKIYDFNGNLKEYIVTKKYETRPNDLNCINQETNGKSVVTLLTCNNVSGMRLVIVCKEIS